MSIALRIAALVAFVFAALALFGRINLVALGLALWVLAELLPADWVDRRRP